MPARPSPSLPHRFKDRGYSRQLADNWTFFWLGLPIRECATTRVRPPAALRRAAHWSLPHRSETIL
jgi:hypothetical protein